MIRTEVLSIFIGCILFILGFIIFINIDLNKDRPIIKKECEEYCFENWLGNPFECAIQCYEWRMK